MNDYYRNDLATRKSETSKLSFQVGNKKRERNRRWMVGPCNIECFKSN